MPDLLTGSLSLNFIFFWCLLSTLLISSENCCHLRNVTFFPPCLLPLFSLPKVLALVFVRKVMDLCFSKRELSWLDDVMPESKKKTLEDAIQKAKQEDVSRLKYTYR